jgi:hypothetical protein
MSDGLYLLSFPSGYSPYVIVGWVEVDGLELVVRGGRVIRRFGTSYSIAELATKGPITSTELLPASKVERLWRVGMRATDADPKVWKKDCPKPKDFRGGSPS